jgi:hypothetical protein
MDTGISAALISPGTGFSVLSAPWSGLGAPSRLASKPLCRETQRPQPFLEMGSHGPSLVPPSPQTPLPVWAGLSLLPLSANRAVRGTSPDDVFVLSGGIRTEQMF